MPTFCRGINNLPSSEIEGATAIQKMKKAHPSGHD